MSAEPVESTAAGPVLRVRVRPKARRDAVTGADERGLKVEVRAAPERGRANDAVIKTLAAWLGIPAASTALASGATGRDKRVLVRGVSAADLRKRVRERFPDAPERTG
jgi:hypothetical protein